MNLSRIKRIKRIREHALKEVQMEYARVAQDIWRLEKESERIDEFRMELRDEFIQLQKRDKCVRSEDLQEVYQFIVYTERILLSIRHKIASLEKVLEEIRNRMMERKIERDVMDKLERRVEFRILQEELKEERKSSDEKAIQGFFRR